MFGYISQTSMGGFIFCTTEYAKRETHIYVHFQQCVLSWQLVNNFFTKQHLHQKRCFASDCQARAIYSQATHRLAFCIDNLQANGIACVPMTKAEAYWCEHQNDSPYACEIPLLLTHW